MLTRLQGARQRRTVVSIDVNEWQFVFHCKHCEFKTSRDTSFVKDVAQMVLYGVFADVEFARNVFVCPSGHDRRCDLEFSIGETEGLCSDHVSRQLGA